MEKLQILLTLTILSISCSPSLTSISKQITVTSFDFTKYNDEEFLFTPDNYLGDYESIGLLSVEILPELKKVSGQNLKPGQFYSPDMLWEYVAVSSGEILDTLYSKAKSLGADSIVHLNFEIINLVYRNVSVPGIRASGFAIKRKGAFK